MVGELCTIYTMVVCVCVGEDCLGIENTSWLLLRRPGNQLLVRAVSGRRVRCGCCKARPVPGRDVRIVAGRGERAWHGCYQVSGSLLSSRPQRTFRHSTSRRGFGGGCVAAAPVHEMVEAALALRKGPERGSGTLYLWEWYLPKQLLACCCSVARLMGPRVVATRGMIAGHQRPLTTVCDDQVVLSILIRDNCYRRHPSRYTSPALKGVHNWCIPPSCFRYG